MSNIATATFTFEPVELVVSPVSTTMAFAPVDNKLNILTNGPVSDRIPAAGNTTEFQFNADGYISSAPTLTYDSVNLVANLGTTLNFTVAGGANGEVLRTDGLGNITWTSNIANANFAILSNHAVYSDIATLANTALVSASTDTANLANVATLAHSLNTNLAGAKISGGANGQFLQTNGNGVLTWANVSLLEPNGVDGAVQFKDGSNLASISTFTVNKTTSVVTLGSNANVVITGGTNGQALVTNGSGGLSWQAVGGGSGGSSALSGLSDVNIPSPTNGQVLTYSTSNNKWVASSASSGASGAVTIYTRTGSANATITMGSIVLVGRTGNVNIATS